MEHRPPSYSAEAHDWQFLKEEHMPEIKGRTNDYEKSGAKTAEEVFNIAIKILEANLRYPRSKFYKALTKAAQQTQKQTLVNTKFKDILGYVLSDNYILAQKIRTEDNRTFKNIYQECRPKVEAILQGKVLKSGNVDDVFQDVIIKLIEKTKMPHFHLNADVQICTFLYKMCMGHLANKRKKDVKEQKDISLDDPDFWINESKLSPYAMLEIDDLGEVQEKQLQEIVSVMGKSGEDCESILKDILLEGYKVKELAKKYNKTYTAMKMKAFRCKNRFEKLIGKKFK